jgi:hypothetical protein
VKLSSKQEAGRKVLEGFERWSLEGSGKDNDVAFDDSLIDLCEKNARVKLTHLYHDIIPDECQRGDFMKKGFCCVRDFHYVMDTQRKAASCLASGKLST